MTSISLFSILQLIVNYMHIYRTYMYVYIYIYRYYYYTRINYVEM